MSGAAIEREAAAPTAEALGRFDRPGPRYTSYPTADRFVDTIGDADYAAALAASAADTTPLALYVHLPFCADVCHYCGCNRVGTRDPAKGERYLAYLAREIDQVAALAGPRRRVAQIHLGGGTPTFHDDAALAGLMARLGDAFDIAVDCERSIEVDPRTVDAGRLSALRAIGFDRLSFGLQDFDPAVQQAIGRIQPLAQVEAAMAAARQAGFASINVDLVHGLPRQTAETFERTLEATARLRPDRIALYGYAHLPERFRAQRRIDPHDLPDRALRARLLARAIAFFDAAGYEAIGMDHFALPDDPLAVARRAGDLQRSFQGYTTAPAGDLLAFGVSAISRVGALYAQNAKSLAAYYARVDAGRLPTERGIRLDDEDRLCRDVIMALMCQGRADLASIAAAHGADTDTFAAERAALAPLAAAGLVRQDDAVVRVTPAGWFFVRTIAMVFDRHRNRAAVGAASTPSAIPIRFRPVPHGRAGGSPAGPMPAPSRANHATSPS